MKHERDISGAASVARISDLPDMQGLVIGCLRHWNRGGAAAALGALRAWMPEPRACAAFDALQDLTETLAAHIRRPLRCHAPHCRCVGRDEAAFARFVEEAALGEREDALMLASLLVTPRAILPLTDAAARLGLGLHRAVVSDQSAKIPEPENHTIH